MAREILFKAKRIDNGEWVEGYYCIKAPYCFDNRTGSKAIIITEHSSTGTVSFEVNPDTICQYTGLTDKNGNKIWENDIAKHYNQIAIGKPNEYDTIKFEWLERDCMFKAFWIEGNGYYFVGQGSVYEVIGNSIDNPELLETLS